jgi:hypothetical protein
MPNSEELQQHFAEQNNFAKFIFLLILYLSRVLCRRVMLYVLIVKLIDQADETEGLKREGLEGK